MRLNAAIMALALTLPSAALAQDEPWPTHPVRLIAASGPGGNPDVLARLLAEKGIPHELDVWGHDVSHDWPWWRKQIAHHLPRFC